MYYFCNLQSKICNLQSAIKTFPGTVCYAGNMTGVIQYPPNLLPSDGEVYYFPQFFAPEESNALLQHLTDEVAWKQEPIIIFGRQVMQPRLTAWYGDGDTSYRYSGISMQPLAWTSGLQTIKKKVDACAGVRFNGALLNFYRNGQDSMGWHRDNEKELGPDPVIASVSFGAVRNFQLRRYGLKTDRLSIPLAHGSLLIMRGKTQHFWEHCLPKSAKTDTARINITFRLIY